MITILPYTTKKPIEMMGHMSGVCYGANVDDSEQNYKRGLKNLQSDHMRVAEFPQVYMILEGYSARVIRELYTHIAGGPTRLQASTRYIDYTKEGLPVIAPNSIAKDPALLAAYESEMVSLTDTCALLEKQGVPREDVANLFPLGMKTKIVMRTNLRHLIDMSHQRMCQRAYWEFRFLFDDIIEALCDYSEQWELLVEKYFKPKCKVLGYCPEERSCGAMPSRAKVGEWLGKAITALDSSSPKDEDIEAFIRYSQNFFDF